MAIMNAALSRGKVLAYLVYFSLDLSFLQLVFAAELKALFVFSFVSPRKKGGRFVPWWRNT